MPKVIYSMGVSLDGFIAGPGGEIDWSAPDEELHRFHNRQTSELGAHLCGRRLYETMVYWESAEERNPSASEYELEFARIWKQLPKIVFSKTLEGVEGNARLTTEDVAVEVARLKERQVKDLAVGGACLASALIAQNLIDEYHLFISPAVLGGGTRYFPPLEERIALELIEARTFGSRVVYLRYERSSALRRTLRRNAQPPAGRPGQGAELLNLDHATLVGADPDRPLPFGHLDVETELAPVDDLAQRRVSRADRALRRRRYMLDTHFEADRCSSRRQVLVGQCSGAGLHHSNHPRRREDTGANRATDIGEQLALDRELIAALDSGRERWLG